MSIYRYDKQSSVNEIVLRRSAGGGVRAFLFAENDIAPDRINGIKEALSQEHYRCVASQHEGRPCLEVRGLRRIQPLEDTLRRSGFLTGPRTTVATVEPKFTLKEKFKSNMLLISGFFNILADVGFIGYGHLESRIEKYKLTKSTLGPEKKLWEKQAAGYAYSTGSIILSAFGRGDKSDHNARDISARLREKMLLDGLTIHEDGAVKSFSEIKGGLGHRLHTFLQKHPSELGNASYAVAGGFMAKSALNSADKNTKILDSVLGASTMMAGATAALVKEKIPDPKAPEPTDLAGKALRWIRQRPNRIAGFGYMVSSIAHGAAAISDVWKIQKEFPANKAGIARLTYGLRGMFTAFNLLAEWAMTLASKGSGNGVKSDNSIEETAYAIVADAISRQPADMRDRLAGEYSRNFLARHDIIGGDPEVVEKTLRAYIENLRHNPWSKTQETQQAAAQSLSQAKPKPAVNWQEKIGMQQGAGTALAPMIA